MAFASVPIMPSTETKKIEIGAADGVKCLSTYNFHMLCDVKDFLQNICHIRYRVHIFDLHIQDEVVSLCPKVPYQKFDLIL